MKPLKSISFILLFTFLFSSLISCKSKESKRDKSHYTTSEEYLSSLGNFNMDTLKGIYTGDFAGSDIRLVIKYISNKHAVGYDVHNGLQRNLSGTVAIKENTIELVLSEPGDNEFDGVFYLNINKENFEAEGYWQSTSGKISKKHFVLHHLNIFDQETVDEDGNIRAVTLTSGNFSDYFYHVTDSIGELEFSNDGICIYKYYPHEDEFERKEQLISFKGSWTLKDNTVVIVWQKNNVFPNKKSTFKINRDKDTDIHESSLTGENRKFDNDFFY